MWQHCASPLVGAALKALLRRKSRPPGALAPLPNAVMVMASLSEEVVAAFWEQLSGNAGQATALRQEFAAAVFAGILLAAQARQGVDPTAPVGLPYVAACQKQQPVALVHLQPAFLNPCRQQQLGGPEKAVAKAFVSVTHLPGAG